MRIRQLSDLIDLNFKKLGLVLIYGNDSLLRSFALELIKHKAQQDTLKTHMHPTMADIHQEQPSLFDLPSDHQVIIVSKVGEKDLVKVRELSDHPNNSATLVVTGDTLTSKGKFVTYTLETPNALAIPCYETKAAEFQILLKRFVEQQQITLPRNLEKPLVEFVMNFPDRFFKEIDKLALYLNRTPNPSIENLNDLLGATDTFQLDQLIACVLLKNPRGISKNLPPRFVEDEFYLIVRSLSKLMIQLYEILSYMSKGSNFLQAQAYLKSPIFFKVKPTLEAASNKWTISQIAKALEEILLLEKRFKNQEISSINAIATIQSLAS